MVFDRYSKVCGTSLSAERKTALLLHCLGPEGQDVFDHLPALTDEQSVDLNDYEICIRKLDIHYLPKVSTILERFHFHKRYQIEGETIEDYITALRKLASSCKFASTIEERIRDQFMVGCNLEKVRNELWQKDEPTLEEVLKIGKCIEHSIKCVNILKKDVEKKPEVQAIQYNKGYMGDKKNSTNFKAIQPVRKNSQPRSFSLNSQPQTSSFNKPKGVCYRCGEVGHFANNTLCPARKMICSFCGIKGHVAKACRNKKVNKSKTQQLQEIQADSDTDTDYECGQIVYSVRDTNASNIHDVVYIEGVPTTMLFDSGAKISIVARQFYQDNLFDKVNLNKPDIKPKAYGGKPIDLLGYFQRLIKYKDRLVTGKIYVSKKGDSILSWWHQKDLYVILDPNSSPSIILKKRPESDMITNIVESNLNSSDDEHFVRTICEEYPEVFSEKLGLLKGYEHHIMLKPNANPVTSKVRALPLAIKDEVKVELEKLIKAGIIEEVEGNEWLAPIVVARKANKSLRLCVDLRALNKCVIVDKYPLPNITDMLTLLDGATVFSSIDLMTAYHQIKLSEQSKNLTAFITPFGTYRYVRLPFGLISAAAVFQRALEKVLAGIKSIKIYQDDILVFGKDKEDHDVTLHKVLTRLKASNLTVKAEKCKFRQKYITYLGHTITAEGVFPREELVNTICGLQSPSNKDELLHFLGMIEYYSKFIDGFAKICSNMRALLKKGTNFVWSTSCEKEFQDLKRCLVKAPALHSFNPQEKSVLTTDASAKGLGAVLRQGVGESERTILFLSRSLREPEQRYSVIEREALAVYWAVKKLKRFLWGGRFVVRTDHKPLCDIFKKKGLDKISGRITKWVIALQDYNFDTEYLPGICNNIADTLSRMSPPKSNGRDFEDKEQEEEMDDTKVCSLTVGDTISEEEWGIETKADHELQVVIASLSTPWKAKNTCDIECRPYWEVRHELSTEGGVLYRGARMVPPNALRKKLIMLAHEGHQGHTKTKERIRVCYWWPGMDLAVERAVRECLECMLSQKSYTPRIQPMCIRALPTKPWQEIAIDLLGPIHGSGLNNYIIVVMDLFSRWPEVKITQKIESGNIIAFLKQLFASEGLPSSMLSDNGTQFTSHETKTFLKSLGVKQKFTFLYHPESNGVVERFNRLLKETIKLAKDNDLNWKDRISRRVELYRFTPHSTTGKTPFQLFRGREACTEICPPWVRTKLDIKQDISKPLTDGGWRQREKMKIAQRKLNFDQRKSTKPTQINVGDWVLIKTPWKKTGYKYEKPVKVIKLFGNAIKTDDYRIWNLNRVVKYKGPDNFSTT